MWHAIWYSNMLIYQQCKSFILYVYIFFENDSNNFCFKRQVLWVLENVFFVAKFVYKKYLDLIYKKINNLVPQFQ